MAPVGRDRSRLEREVLAHAVRRACRQERGRHRQVAEERPVERVAPHPGATPRLRDAFGGHDELAALRQRQPFRIEARGGYGPPSGREQGRHAGERDVTVVEVSVGEIDAQRVEPRRVDLALVVREAVEHSAPRVVCDAREAADGRAGERRPCRDDRLPEELQTRRFRTVARMRHDTASCAYCQRQRCNHHRPQHQNDDGARLRHHFPPSIGDQPDRKPNACAEDRAKRETHSCAAAFVHSHLSDSSCLLPNQRIKTTDTCPAAGGRRGSHAPKPSSRRTCAPSAWAPAPAPD